jgi:hypothetical protein
VIALLILDLWLATGPIRFLVPGREWHRKEKTPREWWAVCDERLVRATVHLKSHVDGDMDELVVDQCARSQLLVRGVPGLEQRSALAAQILEPHHFRWAGDDYLITLEKGAVWLEGNGRRQLLTKKASGAEVRWAGDLDGDGALDLLLDVDEGESGELILFLSRGKNGLRPVARNQHSVGC